MDIQTKTCSKCKRILEINQFAKTKLAKCGLFSWCKECKRDYDKTYLQTILGKAKVYKQNHSLAGKKARNEWYKKEFKNNLSFRKGVMLRSRLNRFLRGNGKTFNLIGCSREVLKDYFSSQFKEGMTWENYGKNKQGWEIDHKIPCRNFDLSSIDEQRKCFHYTNLQPLWAKDNWEKENNPILNVQ